MNHRKKIGVLLFISVLFLFAGYVLSRAQDFGICSTEICSYNLLFSIGRPLFYGTLSPILVLLILMFLRKEVVSIWIKCLFFLVPLYVFSIAVIPASCDSSFICIDRVDIVPVFGKIFFGLSLLIIIGKYIELWHKERKG